MTDFSYVSITIKINNHIMVWLLSVKVQNLFQTYMWSCWDKNKKSQAKVSATWIKMLDLNPC